MIVMMMYENIDFPPSRRNENSRVAIFVLNKKSLVKTVMRIDDRSTGRANPPSQIFANNLLSVSHKKLEHKQLYEQSKKVSFQFRV